MLCPNCGTENEVKAKFCKECGHPLKARQASPRRGLRWPLAGLLLMIAVVSAVGGLTIYRRLGPSDGTESVTAVEHTFDTAVGTDWDTGLGLVVSVPPTTTKGTATVAVQRSPSERIDEAFITSESIYDVSIAGGALTTYSPPVTLSFSIPEGIDPHSVVILEKIEDGWVPAENKAGLPGGNVSADGKRIVVAREHLSRYTLARWLYERIFKHLNKLPQAPPPDPIIEVKQTGGEYLGHPVAQVEVGSPYAVSLELPVLGEIGVGGMWYSVELQSKEASLIRGPGYLAPGEKHSLGIAFPDPKEQASLCLSTKGTLLRAVWDWVDRLGIPHDEIDKMVGGVERLLEVYEHLPEGGTSFKDLVWEAKGVLIELVWELVGWQAEYLSNMVPVSVDVATYVGARTDSRPDPCIDVSAPTSTHIPATASPTTPEHPTLTPAGTPSPPSSGSIAYVAAEHDLWLVDVTDPANMRAISSGSTPHGAVDVFVRSDLAYVGGRYGNLRILDLSDPSQPNELGHVDIPKGVSDIHATESRAFVTDLGGLLHVIDVSNPTNPLDVGRYALSGGNTVQARGSLVYVATGSGLSVVDTSDPSNPEVIGEWGYDSLSIGVSDIEVSGDFAYGIASNRLWVIDVSEPTDPSKVGELSLPDVWTSVPTIPTIDVYGRYAYAATTGEEGQPALHVIDVSLPTDPYQVGFSPLVGQPKDIHVVGSHAYVASGSAGLGVIDVSTPSHPRQVGYWDEIPDLSSAWAVFVTGSERQLPPEAPTPARTPTLTQTPQVQEPTPGGLDIQWSKTFGDLDDDEGHAIRQTFDSGYIVAGVTNSYGPGDTDVLLVRADAQGNWLWYKVFGNANGIDEEATSLAQTPDGGYVIAGFAGGGEGGGDVWLMRTNADGTKVWDRKLGTPRYEERGRSVQQTSDGGYIIAGSAGQEREGADGSLNIDALLMKTDAQGNEQWSRTFGDASWDDGNSVRQTSDGGYILVGQLWPFPRDHDYDAWAIKTDASGNDVWNEAYGTPEHSEFASAVEETPDGGYVVAGGTEIASEDNSDMWLMKIDAQGNRVWDKTFGGPEYEACTSIAPVVGGGYLLAGFVNKREEGVLNLWLVQTDADGNKVWENTFGGPQIDVGTSVWPTSDGGYIVTGYTESEGAGGRDVWLVKLK